ncbi:MAG: hypothetical protein EOP01_10635, partial [Propionibacteriaceae bacterium]
MSTRRRFGRGSGSSSAAGILLDRPVLRVDPDEPVDSLPRLELRIEGLRVEDDARETRPSPGVSPDLLEVDECCLAGLRARPTGARAFALVLVFAGTAITPARKIVRGRVGPGSRPGPPTS